MPRYGGSYAYPAIPREPAGRGMQAVANMIGIGAGLMEGAQNAQLRRDEMALTSALTAFKEVAETQRRQGEIRLTHALSRLAEVEKNEATLRDKAAALGILSEVEIDDPGPSSGYLQIVNKEADALEARHRTLAAQREELELEVATVKTAIDDVWQRTSEIEDAISRVHSGKTSTHVMDIMSASGDLSLISDPNEVERLREIFLHSDQTSRRQLAADPLAWKGAVAAAAEGLMAERKMRVDERIASAQEANALASQSKSTSDVDRNRIALYQLAMDMYKAGQPGALEKAGEVPLINPEDPTRFVQRGEEGGYQTVPVYEQTPGNEFMRSLAMSLFESQAFGGESQNPFKEPEELDKGFPGTDIRRMAVLESQGSPGAGIRMQGAVKWYLRGRFGGKEAVGELTKEEAKGLVADAMRGIFLAGYIMNKKLDELTKVLSPEELQELIDNGGYSQPEVVGAVSDEESVERIIDANPITRTWQFIKPKR